MRYLAAIGKARRPVPAAAEAVRGRISIYIARQTNIV
jgi:hypothetical protein